MLSEYEGLPWETRMGRIAELCSKAVTLYVLKQSATGGLNTDAAVSLSPNAFSLPTASPSMPDDAKAIMVYLRRVRSASPDEITRYTELSHSTVTRRLRELRLQSFVVKIGKTRAVQYATASAI